MKHIVVTGGAGFIGSHTVTELQLAGFSVTILDNFSNSKPQVLDAITEITGIRPQLAELDLCDAEGVQAYFRSANADAVIHFAGLKAVGESCREPVRYYRNNLTGTMNLLAAMSKTACRRLVFSSSAAVYGMQNPAPFTEDMPVAAVNPYGRTKLMIEQILRDTADADSEWAITALRYFNPIGAHASGLIGENPNGIPNNLVPYLAAVAAGKLPFLRVFGNDYDTPDGTGIRDYLHVTDLAKGHLSALSYTESHSGFAVINLGSGKGYSVLEVLQAYEAACGRKLPYVIEPRRTGDVAVSYADTAKAETLLKWKAEKDLLTMCRDSWHFIQKQK